MSKFVSSEWPLSLRCIPDGGAEVAIFFAESPGGEFMRRLLACGSPSAVLSAGVAAIEAAKSVANQDEAA